MHAGTLCALVMALAAAEALMITEDATAKYAPSVELSSRPSSSAPHFTHKIQRNFDRHQKHYDQLYHRRALNHRGHELMRQRNKRHARANALVKGVAKFGKKLHRATNDVSLVLGHRLERTKNKAENMRETFKSAVLSAKEKSDKRNSEEFKALKENAKELGLVRSGKQTGLAKKYLEAVQADHARLAKIDRLMKETQELERQELAKKAVDAKHLAKKDRQELAKKALDAKHLAKKESRDAEQMDMLDAEGNLLKQEGFHKSRHHQPKNEERMEREAEIEAKRIEAEKNGETFHEDLERQQGNFHFHPSQHHAKKSDTKREMQQKLKEEHAKELQKVADAREAKRNELEAKHQQQHDEKAQGKMKDLAEDLFGKHNVMEANKARGEAEADLAKKIDPAEAKQQEKAFNEQLDMLGQAKYQALKAQGKAEKLFKGDSLKLAKVNLPQMMKGEAEMSEVGPLDNIQQEMESKFVSSQKLANEPLSQENTFHSNKYTFPESSLLQKKYFSKFV